MQVGVGEERADDVGHFLQSPQCADDLGLELVGAGDAGAPDAVVREVDLRARVPVLPLVVSRRSPPAPGVRLSPHRALHVSWPLVNCWLLPVGGSTGSGLCCRGSGSGSH